MKLNYGHRMARIVHPWVGVWRSLMNRNVTRANATLQLWRAPPLTKRGSSLFFQSWTFLLGEPKAWWEP